MENASISDKELIKLAAFAAGIECYTVTECLILLRHCQDHIGWNPINDDGDAFRLAVKLELNIQWHQDLSGYVVVWHGRKHGLKEDFIFVGKNSATRRAIVRAAAEIGKSMKDKS